ncbi:MAG TPA: hypothetical protein VEK33_13790 [Terriglobales bacterium]|nr:hypothetical protein [Terriglobales bacterium]
MRKRSLGMLSAIAALMLLVSSVFTQAPANPAAKTLAIEASRSRSLSSK